MKRNAKDDSRTAIKAQERRIATQGVEMAVTALMDVCADRNAPAPARATAGTSLLRAAGMFERRPDANVEKEAHELTAAELQERIEELHADMRAARASADEPENDEHSGVFG